MTLFGPNPAGVGYWQFPTLTDHEVAHQLPRYSDPYTEDCLSPARGCLCPYPSSKRFHHTGVWSNLLPLFTGLSEFYISNSDLYSTVTRTWAPKKLPTHCLLSGVVTTCYVAGQVTRCWTDWISVTQLHKILMLIELIQPWFCNLFLHREAFLSSDISMLTSKQKKPYLLYLFGTTNLNFHLL